MESVEYPTLTKNKDMILIVISHQERLLEIADNIVVIADGKVRIAGPGDEILPQLMQDEKAVACPVEKENN